MSQRKITFWRWEIFISACSLEAGVVRSVKLSENQTQESVIFVSHAGRSLKVRTVETRSWKTAPW